MAAESPQHRLDGKIALVTGGSRGIGRAAALALAKAGARVAVNDKPRAADAICAEIRAETIKLRSTIEVRPCAT